jgi:hypothetical protein
MGRKRKPDPDDPEQSKRFIETARNAEADERPEAFDDAFRQVTEKRPQDRPRRKRRR